MTCCQCEGIEREFDDKFARKEFNRYRRKGLRKTSRMLIAALHRERRRADTLLDIGGGIGGLQHALLSNGVRRAVSVDASSAFIKAARKAAEEKGLHDRIEHLHGDFLDVADRIPETDVVTLDRVICCYHDMERLVGESAAHARHLYGLVYPRDAWWTRLGGKAANFVMRIRKSPMRAFIHPTEKVDAAVRRQGFEQRSHSQTLVWQVVVYRRASG